jgi:hypothetical protein
MLYLLNMASEDTLVRFSVSLPKRTWRSKVISGRLKKMLYSS